MLQFFQEESNHTKNNLDIFDIFLWFRTKFQKKTAID